MNETPLVTTEVRYHHSQQGNGTVFEATVEFAGVPVFTEFYHDGTAKGPLVRLLEDGRVVTAWLFASDGESAQDQVAVLFAHRLHDMINKTGGF